jgi:hypothetical protein
MQTLVHRLRWATSQARVRISLLQSIKWVDRRVPCNKPLNKGCTHRAWGRPLIWGRALCNPAAVPPHSRTFRENEAQRLWRPKTISQASAGWLGSTLTHPLNRHRVETRPGPPGRFNVATIL